jgi:hypothetical protein
MSLKLNIYQGASQEKLKAAKLTEHLLALFNKDKMPVEMEINSLKLFKSLFDRGEFFSEAELAEFLKTFKRMKSNENAVEFLKTHLDQLITKLEDIVI